MRVGKAAAAGTVSMTLLASVLSGVGGAAPPQPPAGGGGGSITIVQDSAPDAPQDFAITGCFVGGGCGAPVPLDDDSDPTVSNTLVATPLTPGSYTLTQTAVSGWTLQSLVCSTGETVDLGQRKVTITLSPGEHTTCTFTNRSAAITLVQDSAPDAPQDFAITGCLSGYGCGPEFPLDDDGDAAVANTSTGAGLWPWFYTVTQAAVAGWQLQSITCDGSADGYLVDLSSRRVTITLGPGVHTTCTFTNIPAAPGNDNFANSTPLIGSSGSVSGTNVSATEEAGEPDHGLPSNAGGSSVWFTWTAPTTGWHDFSTCGSSFRTTLSAYTGTAVNALTFRAGNTLAPQEPGVPSCRSLMSLNATAGTTYRIAVDGVDGDQGDVTLSW
jgi:hypothetical protein